MNKTIQNNPAGGRGTSGRADGVGLPRVPENFLDVARLLAAVVERDEVA